MKILRILTNQYFFLGLILILGFAVRLYKIDSPIADWHSWRQADTAAVTRSFIKEGFNPFIPKYDDMSTVSEITGPNPQRYRFVEFPIYNIFVYPFYLMFGVVETYHRLVSVIFSVAGVVFLYLIARKYTNIITAQIAAFTYGLLPFNVFFSRTTLPEPTFIFFALGMIYFMDKWIEDTKSLKWGLLGFIFTTISFLIKPWAIFFFLPLLYTIYKKGDKQSFPFSDEKRKKFFLKRFLPVTLLSILPFLAWRIWISQHPEGIPASTWLYNVGDIRFRPAFFWWIVSERIGREILGVTGFFLFFLGLILRPKDGNYFLHFWVLSIIFFISIFAGGNVNHDYYQLILVPVASIFLAKGLTAAFSGFNIFVPRLWTIPLGVLFFVLTFYFTWKQVLGLYQINNYPIVEAGRKADQILPKEAVVVAPYNGDTAFLYQINRPGWPIVPMSITSMIKDYGVTHYVSTALDIKTAWVARNFKVLEQTPNYIIIDLRENVKVLDNNLDPEPK